MSYNIQILLFQLSILVTAIGFFLLGSYILYKNQASKIHRYYAGANYFSGVYFTFLYLFTSANTAEEAWLWLRLTAIGHYIVAYVLYALCLLLETKSKKIKILGLLIFSVFTFFFLVDILFPGLTYYPPTKTSLGWAANYYTESFFYYLNILGYVANLLAQALIIYKVVTGDYTNFKKQFARFAMYTYLLPLIGVTGVTLIIPYFTPVIIRIEFVLGMVYILITIFYIWKFNIFTFC